MGSGKSPAQPEKRGIAFEDAIHVFADPHALLEQDRVDESGEARSHTLGLGIVMKKPVGTTLADHPMTTNRKRRLARLAARPDSKIDLSDIPQRSIVRSNSNSPSGSTPTS